MQMPNLSYLYSSAAYQTHNLHKKYIIQVTRAGDRWELVFRHQKAYVSGCHTASSYCVLLYQEPSKVKHLCMLKHEKPN